MEPLETARLLLRPFLPTDWRAVMALFSDPPLAGWAFSTPTTSNTYRWLRQQMAHKEGVSLAILLRSSADLIGWIFSAPERRLFVLNPLQAVEGEMVLRYALASPYWGQGYMTEAVQAVIAYLFTVLQAPQVTADCALDNTASRRVMEKVGMIYAGIEECYAQDMSLLRSHRFVLPRPHWQTQAYSERGGV